MLLGFGVGRSIRFTLSLHYAGQDSVLPFFVFRVGPVEFVGRHGLRVQDVEHAAVLELLRVEGLCQGLPDGRLAGSEFNKLINN